MNNSSITGTTSPLAHQFEIVQSDEVPAVDAIDDTAPSNSELSDETESGLLRFAQFLKEHKKPKNILDKRRAKAFQAYETMMNFENSTRVGQVLDRYK